MFLLLLLLSRRIVRPIAESHEKQKRFLTDAGHELKTPIAIIQADTDVLTLETGEGNEWVTDIQRQVARLTDLTNELMDLARLEEPRGGGNFLPFSFSDLVEETAQSFQALARSQGEGAGPVHPAPAHPGGGGEAPGPAGLPPPGQRGEVRPSGDEITLSLARQGEGPAPHRHQRRPRPQPGGAGEYVRPLLPGGQGPAAPSRGAMASAWRWAKAVVQAHRGRITAAAQAGRLVMTVVLPESPAWGPRPG